MVLSFGLSELQLSEAQHPKGPPKSPLEDVKGEISPILRGDHKMTARGKILYEIISGI